MRISVVSTASPMFRTGALLALSDMAPALIADIDDEGVTMRLTRGLDEIDARRVPLAHSCMTCSLREGITPYLAELAETGTDCLVLALPVAAEAVACVPSLCESTAPGEILENVAVASNLHIVDASAAAHDMFDHVSLADEGVAMFEGDERCTGEVLMNGIGYADLVCSLGADAVGIELVEHLRPLDTLMVHHFDDLTPELVFGGVHDPDAAIARIHPASTEAWGGPGEHGVWTLDLHSDRPFHPDRLREYAADLAPAGVCARGCFWLPSRPLMIGTWEVSGGAASVGSAGEWGGEGAFTHLIVTGIGGEAGKNRVADAFERLLMTEDEMAGALAWIGASDGLDHWFADSEED